MLNIVNDFIIFYKLFFFIECSLHYVLLFVIFVDLVSLKHS